MSIRTVSCFLVCTGLTAASVLSAAAPRTAVLAPILAAQDDEPLVTAALKGVVVLPAPPPAGETILPVAAGVDASRVPAVDTELFALALAPFIGQPASMNSLQRLQDIVRGHLQASGFPLANVFLPPQDATDGVVRVVVQFARVEGELAVAGSRWFAPGGYVRALRQRVGATLDTQALREDVAWLNRNPFRRVRPVLEAGAEPATTRVSLRTEERLPLSLSAGYANTGTRATGEDRLSASLQWGNAFGRGDLLNYGFSADPALKHSRSHSAGYTAFLPWRHVLSLQAVYSKIDSAVPAPFVQGGKNWQAGARYEIPLPPPREGWTQNLSFTADFKYSDNTLEFAAIPITGNETHIAQFGASYGVSFFAFGGRNSATLAGAASPGGLTARNRDRDFDGSRPGARADYVHGKLMLAHRRPLGAGFELALTADVQAADGALLGSEQLNGGGAYAVRGYRESSAFGDAGAVGSAELHAPGFGAAGGRVAADVFVFADAASLNLGGDRESTDLRSAGVGVNVAIYRRLSVRLAYGWQLKALDRAPGERGHGHVAANLAW